MAEHSTFKPKRKHSVVAPESLSKKKQFGNSGQSNAVENSSVPSHRTEDISMKSRENMNTSCSANGSQSGYCPFGGACHTCPALQTKLKINSPGDKYEREADQVADTVMSTNSPLVQRSNCSSCGKDNDNDDVLQTKPVSDKISPVTQIPGNTLNDSLLLRKAMESGQSGAGESITQQLNEARGKGEKLPGATQKFMEQRFGSDFDQVRIHNDSTSATLNNQISSKAFTHGKDIFFSKGYYMPSRPEGQKLIAHELTHVIQQSGNKDTIQRWGGDDHKLATAIASTTLSDNDVKPLASGKVDFIKQLQPYTVSTDFKARRLMWTGIRFASGIEKGEGPDHGEDGNYSTPETQKQKSIDQNKKRQNEYINESVDHYKTFVDLSKKGDGKSGGLPSGRMDKWDVMSLPIIGAVGGAVAGTLGGYAAAKAVSDSVGGGFWGGLLGTLTGLVTVPLGFALGTGLGATGLLGMVTSGLSKRPLTAFQAIFAALGEACHVAQDRGSHWEGVQGHGHDDPKAKEQGWNPDDRAQNPGTRSGDFGGWKYAVENTKKVFEVWIAKISPLRQELLASKKKSKKKK